MRLLVALLYAFSEFAEMIRVGGAEDVVEPVAAKHASSAARAAAHSAVRDDRSVFVVTQFRESVGQCVDRDIHRSTEALGLVFAGPPYVQDQDIRVLQCFDNLVICRERACH